MPAMGQNSRNFSSTLLQAKRRKKFIVFKTINLSSMCVINVELSGGQRERRRERETDRERERERDREKEREGRK